MHQHNLVNGSMLSMKRDSIWEIQQLLLQSARVWRTAFVSIFCFMWATRSLCQYLLFHVACGSSEGAQWLGGFSVDNRNRDQADLWSSRIYSVGLLLMISGSKNRRLALLQRSERRLNKKQKNKKKQKTKTKKAKSEKEKTKKERWKFLKQASIFHNLFKKTFLTERQSQRQRQRLPETDRQKWRSRQKERNRQRDRAIETETKSCNCLQ